MTTEDKFRRFVDKNSDIVNRIDGLDQVRLAKDLKLASKFKCGYYKNKAGTFIHVKGIEVTNDTGDLLRMGFNGEDKGVWVHYCIVDDTSIINTSKPVNTFSCYFSKDWNTRTGVMRKVTKEEFDKKVEEVTRSINSDYESAIDPNEYLKVVRKFNKLLDDVLDEAWNKNR